MKKNIIFWSTTILLFLLFITYICFYFYFATEPRIYRNENIPRGISFGVDNLELLENLDWNEESDVMIDQNKVEKFWEKNKRKCKDENGNLYEPQIVTHYGLSPYYRYFPMVMWTGTGDELAYVCKEKYFIDTWWGYKAPTFVGPIDIKK